VSAAAGRITRRSAAWTALLAAVLAWTAPALAADVRPHARIGLLGLEAAPGAEPAWRRLTIAAPGILSQVEADLGVHPTRYYQIVLISPTGPHDPGLQRLDDEAPPWAAAYMVPRLRVGVIRVAQAARYPYGTLEATLAHEATHLFLDDAVGGRIPLWFNEGVATLQGRRWSLEDMVVSTTALLTSRLPALAELDEYFHGSDSEAQLAYSASFGFVSWATHRYGPAFLREVLRGARTRPFADAWQAAAGRSLADDEKSWRLGAVLRYRWLPLLTASSTLWLGITLLALAAGVRKRSRIRKLREQWDREDTEDEALITEASEAPELTDDPAGVEREVDRVDPER